MKLGTITAGDYYKLPTFPITITGAYTGLEIVVRLWAGRVDAPDWVIEKDLTDDGMDFTSGVLTVEILGTDWPADALAIYEPVKCNVEVEVTVAEISGPVSCRWHDVTVEPQAVGRP
jgi:hypothetical protein